MIIGGIDLRTDDWVYVLQAPWPRPWRRFTGAARVVALDPDNPAGPVIALERDDGGVVHVELARCVPLSQVRREFVQ